jgi:threo-3-hydroxy-L-aspartate ammonia-lyase
MIRPVTLIESVRLSRKLGVQIILASETFQHTGSFKYRAAWNVAKNVPHKQLLAASSGNFGQALAYACQILEKRCTIVMPQDSATVKIKAVREYGATADLIDVRLKTRKERVDELAAELSDVYIASAYDDDLVIAGNSSLGREIAQISTVDTVIAPVGGGGLAAGIVQGLREAGRSLAVVGAEPAMANDAARSLRAGHLVRDITESATIADGARTLSLGERNFAILKQGLGGIVEVSEEQILDAVRLLFHLANLKAEPTGALALGAVLADHERFRGRTVCCVISGGNVDASFYAQILASA